MWALIDKKIQILIKNKEPGGGIKKQFNISNEDFINSLTDERSLCWSSLISRISSR
jgi:hypothetical protein